MKKLLAYSFVVFILHVSSVGASTCEESYALAPFSEQLLRQLEIISPNKKQILESLPITSCGENCLAIPSGHSLSFQVVRAPHLLSPEVTVSPFQKTLKLPSSRDLKGNLSLIKSFLIGHELHPQIPSGSDFIQWTDAQKLAFQAVEKALRERASSFLHISPTGTGKTLVLTHALKKNLTPGLHLVTAHQIHLVDQLYEAIQDELRGTGAFVINWNNKANRAFAKEVERAVSLKEPVVFVVTAQTLKSQFQFLENKRPNIYKKLTENARGIYLDEAHHLGAFQTKSALLKLKERSGAFLYGTTATPSHYEINLRELFEKEHWSYLSGKENLFESHPAERIFDQLSLAIKEGEIIPFDDLYIIGESSFYTTEESPLFMQGDSGFYVLNPDHYSRLAGILSPIIESNRKGFIVTASIAEADRLAVFLDEAFEGEEFEAYHSDLTREERLGILSRSEKQESHYIVAVKALDEGVNLPHLSAYIDLNTNVSVKQMAHRIGRVLRLYPGKAGADIVFLSAYRDAKEAADLLYLLDVAERTAFDFSRRVRRESGDSRFRGGDVTPLSREELLELRRELEASVRSFWNKKRRKRLSFDEVREILIRKGIYSQKEYLRQRQTDPELQRILRNLERAYPEWPGWPYFQGKPPRISRGTKPSLDEVREMFQILGIRTQAEFEKQREKDPVLKNVPVHFSREYRDEGWRGWRHFRGEEEKPSLEEVLEIFQRKGIRTRAEYEKQRQTDPELQKISISIWHAYKKEGWKGWPHLRGEERAPRISRDIKLSLHEALEMFRRKGIDSQPEYRRQRQTDPELQRISVDLRQAYKKEGWRGWPHFRGEERAPQISKNIRPPLSKMLEIFRRKGIRTQAEFERQREKDPALKNVPAKFSREYRDEGWRGWRHFRGEGEKPSLEEVLEIFRRKGIQTQAEYEKQRETDPELQQIPIHVSVAYKKHGWPGWRHLRNEEGAP